MKEYTEGEWSTYPLAVTDEGITWKGLPVLVLVTELTAVAYYVESDGCSWCGEHSSGRLTSEVQHYYVVHADERDEILPSDIEEAIEAVVVKHEEANKQ